MDCVTPMAAVAIQTLQTCLAGGYATPHVRPCQLGKYVGSRGGVVLRGVAQGDV